ncbi:mRNA capping enzyme [uncultured virus]|nr:mRNA capping enzyme [uncultured virus]
MVDAKPNSMLTDNQLTQIKAMIAKHASQPNLELEVSFRNLSYESFMRVSEYYVNITDDDKITAQVMLDISMELPDRNTYRVSLMDQEDINVFVQRFEQSRYDEVRQYILGLKSSETIEIIFKDRSHADRAVIDDYDLAFRLTSEIPITSKNRPQVAGTERLHYRYKTRYSFNMGLVRLDITDVQESPSLRALSTKPSRYEIEIEATDKAITLDRLLTEVIAVLKVTQDTDVPIGKTEAASVIQQYRTLLNAKSVAHIDGRVQITITKKAIINSIPNQYAITDKADGDRYFLFIAEGGIYLLSSNMVVKKADLLSPPAFYRTLLDGELIMLEGRRVYLAFDVVYSGGIDYRHAEKYTLVNRISVLNKIIDTGFKTLVPFTDYTAKHKNLELGAIKAFYSKELASYWSAFKTLFSKGPKDNLFVTRKLYFVPYGIDPSEVFMYADMVWRLSTYGKLTPYRLDGIIYTPINTPYLITPIKGIDSLLEYKWKPPGQNSIDFYIEFIKDAHGSDAIYYDGAVMQADSNPYKICTLHGGISRDGQERPVPFKVKGVDQRANVYISDGEARDIEGNPIYGKTVVEFIFDMTNPDIEDAFKWTPLRTRYDKTESIRLYGRKYGNYISVASSIWKTIVNPVTEDHIAALADPASFPRELERLRKSEETSTTRDKSAYYQKKTDIGSGMRAFNNFIKSNIIMTYCTNKQSVLDIGCGRGGDLRKFIFANVGEYVGVDIDNNGLFVISDSANNRYKSLAKTLKRVPPMQFIQADARAKFNTQAQLTVLPNMTQHNQKLIATLLSGKKQYDVINAQFTLHYYLSDAVSWSNFCDNVNKHLAPGGYMLVTCFDGKLLADKLRGKQQLSIVYTDNNGNKVSFAEINKIYADSELEGGGIGLAIDLMNSMISDQQIREYLVLPEFLEASLKEKCGLELVETDSFFNLFNLYRNYFTGENVERIKGTESGFYRSVRDFYLSLKPDQHTDIELDAAKASFKFSMLNRYFVFKKSTPINIEEPSRIVGVNHKINLDRMLLPYFGSNRTLIDPARSSRDINKIYRGIIAKYGPVKPSVYLVRHTVIENGVDDMQIRRNRLDFSKVKGGAGDKTVMIYRSPEKLFYPIYYQRGSYGDFESYLDEQLSPKYGGASLEPASHTRKYSRTYLLDSNKIGTDLDMLVELTHTPKP